MTGDARPFSELIDSGLLWLLNTSVFHPRGFGLAIHIEGDVATGWSIVGDGSEPWVFEDGACNDKFDAVAATFRRAMLAAGTADCTTCGGTGTTGDEGGPCPGCCGDQP